MTPTSVTVHNTNNPDTTAKNSRDYFSNHPDADASTHYVVDDKEIVRCIPENEVSWHAGSVANRSSISIEVCEFTNKERQAKANENAAMLVADILTRYKWGVSEIKTHRDWTGKNCPRLLIPMWSKFIRMVETYLPKDALTEALEVMRDAGIISSFDYWQANARQGQVCKGDYVMALILKTALKLKEVNK